MKYIALFLVTAVIAVFGFGISPAESMAAEWPIFSASAKGVVACNSCHFVGSFSMLPLTLGMIVDAPNLASLFVNIKTSFMKAFEAVEPKWQKIATLVPSTSKTNDYKWLGTWPKLREWLGERIIERLAGHSYSIANKKYTATIAIDADDIDDDNIGGLAIQAADSGQSAAEWPDDLVFPLLENGFGNLCFDGQPFFDIDHPNGDEGVFSNLGTKKLNATDLAKAKASYGDGREKLLTMTDSTGHRLKIRPNLLVVPVQLV